MVSASPEIARRAGRAFWIRKWRTGFGVFSLGAIACVIATIIWMVALFGPARAPLGVPATILAMMIVLESGWLFGVPRALARAASGGRTSEVNVEDDAITVKKYPVPTVESVLGRLDIRQFRHSAGRSIRREPLHLDSESRDVL